MELEQLDWSFGLVVVLVVVLVLILVARHLLARRRQKRADKKARLIAYKEWLHSSGMDLPKGGSKR